MEIAVVDLVKDYGKFRALDTVTLNIGAGLFGLLGPNGAGKTTLMKILTTILPPTSGEVVIGGKRIEKDADAIRQHLGYLPQEFGFYGSLNAIQLLDYIGTMKNLSKSQRLEQIERLLEQVNLTKDAKRRVGGYSGGMKQRLGIAQALMGDPDILIVDEPTAGLDPEERIRFRNLLARISGQRTVILSTHIVGDIEAVCTRVAVMNKGQIVFQDTPGLLTAQAAEMTWEVEVTPTEYDALERSYPVISSRMKEGKALVRLLSKENPLGRGTMTSPDLEDGYVAVMSGLSQAVSHA